MLSIAEKLSLRACLYADIRSYFADTGVIEVTTPYLSVAANTDPAIEPFVVQGMHDEMFYLHTSPEFFMKRLLVEGSGSIYQIASVFRQEESGRYHSIEFSMLEWYRVGYDYRQLMDDVTALVRKLSARQVPVDTLSYQQAFGILGVDPLDTTTSELAGVASQHGLEVHNTADFSVRQWLDLLMHCLVEPGFDKSHMTFIYDYPADQASLARLKTGDCQLAERFELFFGGVELANGFTELQDADEQRQRFEKEIRQRQLNRQQPIPLDSDFLAALQKGLPYCSGVALGLDRLMMVLSGADNLGDVQF